MTGTATRRNLRDTIAGALKVLQDGTASGSAPGPETSLPGLLDQCREMVCGVEAPPTVRTIHHLACTGGTLIARCIGSLPNTQVLSEIDPLSKMQFTGSKFFPTDIVRLAKFSSRPSSSSVLVEIFLAGLDVLYQEAQHNGFDLILRDHAHSHFTYGPNVEPRPSLRDIVTIAYPVRSMVTVRHPFDSFLSLEDRRWRHFEPFTVDEYAKRYHAFLDRYAGLECMRYEDFVADPETQMKRICAVLNLSYDPKFLRIFPAIRLSGDSGRRGGDIAPRPRRAYSEDLIREASGSEAFGNLLTRLGYDLVASDS